METVKVRLRKPRRVFTFLTQGIALHRDEPCIVQSDRGVEWGVCILPPEPCPPEMERRYSMRVLRRAEDRDFDTFHYLCEEEARAYDIAFHQIRRHELPMKLVDVEYSFDKKKIVFYFTADDRVDFRELVRDLAHELRTRIELRHIQVRDEAKMVGGIGSCGRELCCTTWLNEFKPISMRMAKRQNLSLNPSKISGQCGRLLCCLSYENDLYETAKRRSKQESAGPKPPAKEARQAEAEDAELLPDMPEEPAAGAGEWVPAAPPAEGAGVVEGDDQARKKRPRKRSGRRRRGKKPGDGEGGGDGGGPSADSGSQ